MKRWLKENSLTPGSGQPQPGCDLSVGDPELALAAFLHTLVAEGFVSADVVQTTIDKLEQGSQNEIPDLDDDEHDTLTVTKPKKRRKTSTRKSSENHHDINYYDSGLYLSDTVAHNTMMNQIISIPSSGSNGMPGMPDHLRPPMIRTSPRETDSEALTATKLVAMLHHLKNTPSPSGTGESTPINEDGTTTGDSENNNGPLGSSSILSTIQKSMKRRSKEALGEEVNVELLPHFLILREPQQRRLLEQIIEYLQRTSITPRNATLSTPRVGLGLGLGIGSLETPRTAGTVDPNCFEIELVGSSSRSNTNNDITSSSSSSSATKSSTAQKNGFFSSSSSSQPTPMNVPPSGAILTENSIRETAIGIVLQVTKNPNHVLSQQIMIYLKDCQNGPPMPPPSTRNAAALPSVTLGSSTAVGATSTRRTTRSLNNTPSNANNTTNSYNTNSGSRHVMINEDGSRSVRSHNGITAEDIIAIGGDNSNDEFGNILVDSLGRIESLEENGETDDADHADSVKRFFLATEEDDTIEDDC
jgi:hypothetical protein